MTTIRFNRDHPLANGLVWLFYGTPQERVGGGIGRALSGAGWGVVPRFGFGLRSDSTSIGGAVFPFAHGIASLTTEYTMAVMAQPTAIAAYSTLLSIPYHNGNFNFPHHALNLGRNNQDSNLRHWYGTGGNFHEAISTQGIFSTSDPLSLYAVGRQGAAVTFLKNGETHSSHTFTNAAITWSGRQEVCVGAAASFFAGETTAGLFAFAGIWGRALSAAEHRLLWQRPQDLIEPVRPVWRGVDTTPAAVAPVADFSATPVSGTAPLTVTFTDLSTNTPTAWAWDFGNGGTSTQQNPLSTYNVAGTYTVTLTATNAGGSDSEIKTALIVVSTAASAPVANFTATPLSGAPPLAVQFTDTSTGSPSGWLWNFGDGGTSTSPNPLYTYLTAGTYTVTLTVTNAAGSDGETKTALVNVGDVLPSVPSVAGKIVWRVYVDWNRDGDFSDASEDVTPYLIDARWRIGMRKAFQDVGDENTCTLTLRNTDRRFSPDHAASPLFGQLLPHRQVLIRASWEGTTYTLYRGWVASVQPTPLRQNDQTATVEATGLKALLQEAEITLPLLQNVTTDQALEVVVGAVELPVTLARAWRAGVVGATEAGMTTYLADRTQAFGFEGGQQTFAYVGDNWHEGVDAYAAIRDLVAAERGRFYVARDGKAVFHNRRYVQTKDAVDATIVNLMTSATYAHGEYLANDVKVTAYPRALSANANEILYTLSRPIKLKPGETKTVRARYAGEAGERVAGVEVQLPTGADFVSTLPLVVRMTADATSAELVLLNDQTVEVEVTTIVLRGRKLTAFGAQTAQQVDTVSLGLYGRRAFALDLKLLEDDGVARDLAAYEAARRGTPRGAIGTLTLYPRDATRIGLALGRTVGDRLTVTEHQTGHTGDYFLIGEEHELRDALTRYTVTWSLEPAAASAFWRVGTTGRGELGTQTKAGL